MPAGGVFEGVVASAEVVEAVGAGGAAVGPIRTVVDVAAVDGLAASGESAAFVAGAEEAFQVGVGCVAVDGEDAAGDGVAEHPIPAGGVSDEAAGGVDVDGGASDQFGPVRRSGPQARGRGR